MIRTLVASVVSSFLPVELPTASGTFTSTRIVPPFSIVRTSLVEILVRACSKPHGLELASCDSRRTKRKLLTIFTAF